MNRNLLLVLLLGSALALAGCADTDESVNDPDALGDAEDDGLDMGDDNDTTTNGTATNVTTDTSTDTTTDTGLYGG